MAKAHLLIFDDCLGKWGPMKDMRAVFELLTGAVSTQTRIERVAEAHHRTCRAPSLQNMLARRQPLP